jgi:Protein of unknown function (DUF2911)/Tetratricopeptide repeat
MKNLLRCALPLIVTAAVFAQVPGLTLPPSGNNQKASVIQYIGPVEVRIDYSSPAVHFPPGNDRRGKIWGKLVPYGEADLGLNHGKKSPWRAGANENTVFTVSEDVNIEGQRLPAGRYGLSMVPGPDQWTIVFNKNSSAWGSFFYNEADDALRVTVKPHSHPYREWLTYEFTVRKPAEAVAELQWEDLAVPWTITVPNISDVYISHLRRELTGASGLDNQSYLAAAQYCVLSNSHLEEGLQWADDAINMPFFGQTTFNTLSTKALVLSKLNRQDEAKALMETALKLPGTTAMEIHQYGRQLLAGHQPEEAMKVFEYNAQRNGDAWPVHVGLARGYAALGNRDKALENAEKALAQAPDPINKQSLEGMIQKLKAGDTNVN